MIDIVRAVHAELIKFMLPPKTFARLLEAMADLGNQFACFTSTKVQILTPEALHARLMSASRIRGILCYVCKGRACDVAALR